MTTTPRPVKHYFVINKLGQSASRLGPFNSEHAAREWVKKNLPDSYPAWILPLEYVGKAGHRALNSEGMPAED